MLICIYFDCCTIKYNLNLFAIKNYSTIKQRPSIS